MNMIATIKQIVKIIIQQDKKFCNIKNEQLSLFVFSDLSKFLFFKRLKTAYLCSSSLKTTAGALYSFGLLQIEAAYSRLGTLPTVAK